MANRSRRVRALGARVEYRSADVADRAAVEELVRHVRATYGQLDGVVHAAGVVEDSFLVRKTDDELRRVFAAKVTGSPSSTRPHEASRSTASSASRRPSQGRRGTLASPTTRRRTRSWTRLARGVAASM